MGVVGDRPDFAEFYRDAVDDCLRAVVVTVGDADVARDLVDESFARAWASWHTVSRHPAPKAWIVRTALNAGVSRWRRRRREIPVASPAEVTEPSPASAASEGWVDPQVMTALRRLPERQRQVVALRLILDLDTNTTAEALGIAPGTVMAHLARAMTTLRGQLEPDLQQEHRS